MESYDAKRLFLKNLKLFKSDTDPWSTKQCPIVYCNVCEMSQYKICLARSRQPPPRTTPFLNGLSAWQANCEIGWCSHMFLSWWWWWCWWERERSNFQLQPRSSSSSSKPTSTSPMHLVLCSRVAHVPRSRCYRTTSLLGYLMFISAWVLPLMMILLGAGILK